MEEDALPPEDESLLPLKEDVSEWLSTITGQNVSTERFFDELQTGSVLCKVADIIYQRARTMPSAQVLQKQKRNVILCLLEVARIASRLGLPAPQLIHLERDIALEQEKNQQILLKMGCQNDQYAQMPPSMDKKRRREALQLDKAVFKIVDGPKFKGMIDIERAGEGRYRIHNKLVFIRMLRNKHIMIRVGGGWDSLEHYLDSHEMSRTSSHHKLLSFTDITCKVGDGRGSTERKFHQFRTRIPLRTKQS